MVTIVVPRGFRSDRRLALPRVLTPLYVKTRVLSGLDDGLACAEVCHDALVDLSRKEAFQASDDLAFGPAIGGASGDVVAGWLVESHADDDGSIEGGVGVSVAASIEAVPAGGHPGRGRDRARAAELREGGVRTNPVSWLPYELPAGDDRQISSEDRRAVELRVRPPPAGTHQGHRATSAGSGMMLTIKLTNTRSESPKGIAVSSELEHNISGIDLGGLPAIR